MSLLYRVTSGKFGLSAKFGQRPCLFHILDIAIKDNFTMQTVQIEHIARRSLVQNKN